MAKKKPQISLSSAEEVRDKITAKQAKQIKAMFSNLAKEAREKAEKLKGKDNISSIIQRKYLEDLAKELEHQLNADFANLKKNLEQDMTQVSESVIDCVREFEESVGMPISNSWLNVPVDAVEAVQSGKLYAGNWTLSSRIWGMEKKVMKDINTVIAEGIAANKSAYDIAKDLEKYVDPKAKKDWNWSKVYPGTNRKVDYSAQRLARTMVSHAYQFSFVESTKDNPFIEKYKWISSHDKRVCPICKERDGKLFDKDKLPLDHPNGRCTFVSVFNKSATQISDEMAAWVKGKEGDFPKIDEYMKKKFGTDRYDKAMQMAMQGMKQEVGKVEKVKLIRGSDDPEITGAIKDFYLPSGVRGNLEYYESIKTYSEFEKFFESRGIKLETDLESLKTLYKDDEKEAVSSLAIKIAVAIDSYKEVFGKDALSKLKKIVLYSEDETATASYRYNAIGENDPTAGSIHFRDWSASGKTVFHELAHAFQDSHAKRGEDAVSYSNRMVVEAALDKSARTYSGADADAIEAERFADAFANAFYTGEDEYIEFLERVKKNEKENTK